MKLDMNKINLIKAERNINNVDIAKMCNISRPWLSNVFNSNSVSPQIVNKLSKGLEVPVSELLLKE